MFKRPSTHYGKSPQPETPLSACLAGLGRTHRLGPRAGEELAADGLRLTDPVGRTRRAVSFGNSVRGSVVPWVVQRSTGSARHRSSLRPRPTISRPIRRSPSTSPASSSRVRSIPADPVYRAAELGCAPTTSRRRAARWRSTTMPVPTIPSPKLAKQQIAVDVSSVIRASPDSFRHRLGPADLPGRLARRHLALVCHP